MSNTIKLFPLDQNKIALLEINEIILVEAAPQTPDDFVFNTGSTLIGGDDIKKIKRSISGDKITGTGGQS